MAVRWFRISFARNAFLRLLVERGATVGELTIAEAVRAFVDFSRDHRPQHAELDETSCRWNATSGEFTLTRTMRRHDHPEATVELVLIVAADGSLGERRLA